MTFRRLCAVAALSALALGGCAASSTIENGYDPAVPVNRQIHAFNKGVDTALLRPASKVYGAVVPATVKHIVHNELRYLSLPRTLANSLLQGNLERVGDTAARLFVNTTLGGLGALDPATEMGIPEHDEDFGQTLAVWGAPAGPYLELPLLGPSTVRAVFGRVGDYGLDPLNYVGGIGDAATALSAGRRAADIIDTRHRFGQVLDEVLYESDDSYAMVRNLYLQRRNNAILNGEISTETLPDIYEAEPF